MLTRFLHGVRALLLAVLAFSAACGGGGDRPTIILITIDTCRADHLGVAGMKLTDGSSPTPELDRLAADGRWYPQAFSPVPLTLPAHASIMTGLYPDHHGMRENDSFRLAPRAKRAYPTLAEELRRAGYETVAFVSAQPLERRFGLDSGFRTYDQPERTKARGGGPNFRERPAEETVAQAQAWMQNAPAGPWLLFAHFFDPHRPYERHAEFSGLPPGEKGSYLSEIMAVDRAIGRLLAALPDGGRRAWVIVAGDHGEGLGEHDEPTHGFFLYDSTLHVPLIVRPPIGGAAPPVARPARLIDIFPTVLAIAGAPPVACDGENLLAPPTKPFMDRAESLYAWYQCRWARVRAMRDASAKVIEGGGREEVYLWPTDPAEVTDVAASRPADVARMRALLNAALMAPTTPTGALTVLTEPDVAGPYIGGRPPGALEPTEEQNKRLPHPASRWSVAADIDAARAHLARGEAAKALLLLLPHAAERDGNPALLLWTGRAEREMALDTSLKIDLRLGHLADARARFHTLSATFGDARGVDAEILVLRDRNRLTGARSDLDALVSLATGEIAAGGGSAVTFALRGAALLALGDRVGAEKDLVAASRIDPEDPRIQRDLAELRAGLAPP